ncbi:hypothetical protein ACFL21_05125 [Patescibacteria group bacterium]
MNQSKLKSVHFITGASGVGKTVLLSALKNEFPNENWAFLHFDSIGVPSFEEMEKQFGSPSAWQEAMTYKWIKNIFKKYSGYEKVFFEGQVNLEFILQGFKKHNYKNYKITLIDCSEEEMAYRLTHHRNQPELLSEDMKNWLKFLRNQAKELSVSILDTTNKSKVKALEEFKELLSAFR